MFPIRLFFIQVYQIAMTFSTRSAKKLPLALEHASLVEVARGRAVVSLVSSVVDVEVELSLVGKLALLPKQDENV